MPEPTLCDRAEAHTVSLYRTDLYAWAVCACTWSSGVIRGPAAWAQRAWASHVADQVRHA